MASSSSTYLQECLDRLGRGDTSAREALLDHSRGRLRLLAAKMLRKYPHVHRWEDTDDVLQRVLLRLDRMLGELTVSSVRDYLRLAATHIRRELIDLARHYYGPEGLGAHHVTPREPPDSHDRPTVLAGPPESSGDPAALEGWAEFHRRVSELPDEEREVFELVWYQGLTQPEAAEVLGVSLRTVKRRWQCARLALMTALGGELPF